MSDYAHPSAAQEMFVADSLRKDRESENPTVIGIDGRAQEIQETAPPRSKSGDLHEAYPGPDPTLEPAPEKKQRI